MGSPRRTTVVALLLSGLLCACGETEDDGGLMPEESESVTGVASRTPSETAQTATSATEATGLPSACDVLAPTDVAAAYGVEFGPGSPGGGGHTEQDVEWQSDNCDWEAEDLMEVQLALTRAEDFTTGSLTCPEPTAIASTVTPVRGLATTQAWWEVDDAPPLEATLRVCTEAYNFDIDVEFEDGVDYQGDPKDQTIALAKAVLVALG